MRTPLEKTPKLVILHNLKLKGKRRGGAGELTTQ